MEQTVFSEKMAGLTIDEVIRDYEFTMQTKHFHDSFELYFLLEGERYYFIDRETYHVKKGMVVLVNRQPSPKEAVSRPLGFIRAGSAARITSPSVHI